MGSALRTLARTLLPHHRRRWAMRQARRVTRFGLGRVCPVCKARLRRFDSFGTPPRQEACCPICESLERHRLAYLYLTQRTDFFDGRPKAMLHMAPEPRMTELFRRAPRLTYVSGDLESPLAMAHMDITRLPHADNTFDVIFCSHVLEHIPDDRRAMRELFRVLKPGGWAILQVPQRPGKTYEDFSITDPKERERAFGQFDHVRWYGDDYPDRLREAGFEVTVDRFARELPEADARRMGIMRSEDVHLCRKRS